MSAASLSSTDKGIVTNGMWTDVSSFKESSAITASLLVGFVGDEATLTMGTGPDHGFYDVYMDGSLWQSFDGYAAAASQRDILIPLGADSRKLSHEGPHVLEIRVRTQRHPSASGNKVRLKQVIIPDRGYTLHTIRYSYDALARLREARYAPGLKANAADADLQRRYQYAFDLSGNRTQQIVTIAGSATTTNYGYNAANQVTSAGAAALTYDHNGNLTNDGATAYTWDRANRMIGAGSVQLAYDGAGNRIKQTAGATVTQYLLDLQPGLAVVLAATTAANTDRYVHGSRGIHAQKDAAGNWEYPVQDGLGSVRGVADNAALSWSAHYDPFGTGFGAVGTQQTSYGFTGEQYDPLTDLLYLRARHYKPGLGLFTALDPFEGTAVRPMSRNGYSWVEGNPVNRVDRSGKCPENPAPLDAFGWRCRFLAEGLAARTAQPVENFMWMDYGQLEALTALGTAADVTGGARQFIDNAAIIPRLFRENPVAALQALEKFACQNRETIQGFTATAVIATAQLAFQSGVFGSGSAAFSLGSAGSGFSAGGIGITIAGGVILTVGGLILWDDLTRQQLGSNILEARITPRSNRDWDYLSRRLGIGRNTLSDNLHDCKFNAGVPPDGNVQVDDETGDIYYRGEYIGNIKEGC